MKKYTILDSTGQKKIVYAPNMKKALRYVGDGEKTVKDSKFYVILSNYDYTKAQAEKDARKYGLKLQILGPANGSKQETEAYLVGPRANIVRMLKETDMDEFEGDIEDSIKDSKFYSEEDATEAKKKAAKYGLQVKIGKKVSNGPNKGFDEIYYIGPKDKLTKMLNAEGFDDNEISEMIEDSKVKDADANIVDKLIAEEEKAVMDYKEALMADSDLSANAVYAHILAEELEHLRELRSLKEQPSLGDSIKDEVQTAETYANTGWIEKLASDLLNEGQKNGYDFDAVLKKFDSLSKQILVIVKNALDKAKKEVVDYKSRY